MSYEFSELLFRYSLILPTGEFIQVGIGVKSLNQFLHTVLNLMMRKCPAIFHETITPYTQVTAHFVLESNEELKAFGRFL